MASRVHHPKDEVPKPLTEADIKLIQAYGSGELGAGVRYGTNLGGERFHLGGERGATRPMSQHEPCVTSPRAGGLPAFRHVPYGAARALWMGVFLRPWCAAPAQLPAVLTRGAPPWPPAPTRLAPPGVQRAPRRANYQFSCLQVPMASVYMS